jgi:hypothetical protein
MINTTNIEKAHNSANSSHYIHGKKRERWALQKVHFPHHYVKIGLIDDEYTHTHTYMNLNMYHGYTYVRMNNLYFMMSRQKDWWSESLFAMEKNRKYKYCNGGRHIIFLAWQGTCKHWFIRAYQIKKSTNQQLHRIAAHESSPALYSMAVNKVCWRKYHTRLTITVFGVTIFTT